MSNTVYNALNQLKLLAAERAFKRILDILESDIDDSQKEDIVFKEIHRLFGISEDRDCIYDQEIGRVIETCKEILNCK